MVSFAFCCLGYTWIPTNEKYTNFVSQLGCSTGAILSVGKAFWRVGCIVYSFVMSNVVGDIVDPEGKFLSMDNKNLT